MMKKLLSKSLLLLCAFMAGSSSAWADSKPWSGNDPASTLDLATITSSTMGTWNGETSWYLDDDYLIVTGYESSKSVGNQTWITQNNVGNSSSSWDASTPFKGSLYYTNANYATIQSGRYLLYKVTNMKSLKVYGKNNKTTIYLDIFIYTKTSDTNYKKIEEIKYTTDNNNHIWENIETLDPAETYYIYITGVGSSNSRVFEVAFERNVSITKHTLTSEVSPANSGTVTLGATSIGEGSTTSITATPADGYRFVNWTVSGTGASVASTTAASTTFTMGTTDATVTANFEVIPSHSITSVVSPTEAGSIALEATSIKEGLTTTATASANAGYKFTGWTINGDGATLSNATDNPVTISIGTTDATITANFEAVTTYAINWSVNGTVVKTDNVEEDGDIAFVAPASEYIPTGYTFMGWSETTVVLQATAPAYISSGVSDGNKTFYAVLAVESGLTPATLTKMSSTDTFTAGDKVVIVADDNNTKYAIYQETTSTSWVNKYIFDGKASSVSTDNKKWLTVSAGSGSTWKLGDDTDGYLYTSGSNNLIVDTENSSNFTLAYSTGNGFTLKTGGRWLSLRTDATTNTFRLGGNGSTPLGVGYFDIYKYTASSVSYSNYCTTIPTGTITLNAACNDGDVVYGTFYTDRAYIMPESLDGSVVSVDSEGKLVVDVAYEGSKGDVVPANTPLLINSYDTFTGTKDYTITYTSATGEDFSDYNMLKGTLTADETTTGDNCLFYRLTMHNGTQIGFWWGAANGGAFKPGANKAYLAVPDAAAARIQSFWLDGETAGISSMHNSQCIMHNEVYDLQGRRVESSIFNSQSSILKKGLYIVNGKKVIK